MPDKYSLAACEHYGRRLAARLCQQQFASRPEATLDGPALLQLTPLRQLNLLVLHQLLGRWQQEAERLRSPYFDFEAAPVQAALGQLLNVLSRHIAVGRAALEPLLAEATTTTLLLALDAPAAFERVLLPPASSATEAAVPAAYLRERLRYLALGKPLFEGFVASLLETPLPRPELLHRFGQYQASHPEQHLALAPLLTQLSALLPLTEADLLAAPPAATQHPAATLAEARAKAEDAASPAEPDAAAAPPPAPAAAPAPVPRPVVPSFVAPAKVPLYEKLKATQPAPAPLAARLGEAASPAAPSLAERGGPKVGSLREAISINQRYSFINELFGGENMDYHAAIAHLDELPTPEAALAYVRQELATRHDWSRKEEHVARLLKLIERKFGPPA